MVSFQRMKDEFDGFSTQVSTKLPVVGRSGCMTVGFILVAFVIILGLAIGLGVQKRNNSGGGINDAIPPAYIFVSNSSGSCPPLVGDRLLTTIQEGGSFDGLVVSLACRGDYNPFPNQVKCRRRPGGDSSAPLEWSHLPVCYPSVLVSKAHWSKTLHARSVSCVGNSTTTECRMSCIRDYVAIERNPYACTSAPCKAWELGESTCYMCDQNCTQLHSVNDPKPDRLLGSLGCQSSCYQIIVNSDDKASVWQNKRTGLFEFMGEHNGKPVYQNNVTKEFLFFTFTGSEWLVGPDFRKPHAGIQVFGNDDTSCPERSGGKNISRLYIDSSEPSPGGTGKWTKDDTLSFECYGPTYKTVKCECKTYKVYNTVYVDGKVPDALTYLTGTFKKMDSNELNDENDDGGLLLAPTYYDSEKTLFLFSHHPRGKVWQVSTKFTTTPLRGVHPGSESACPDNDAIQWEWFNASTPEGQQIYIKDANIHVKCIDTFS